MAALLYTAAIAGGFLQRGLRPWSVATFGMALALDSSATLIVCVLKAASLAPTFHALMGWLALAIMAVHFVWALSSVKQRGRAATYFHYGSPAAWVLWMVAFISGIPA